MDNDQQQSSKQNARESHHVRDGQNACPDKKTLRLYCFTVVRVKKESTKIHFPLSVCALSEMIRRQPVCYGFKDSVVFLPTAKKATAHPVLELAGHPLTVHHQ